MEVCGRSLYLGMTAAILAWIISGVQCQGQIVSSSFAPLELSGVILEVGFGSNEDDDDAVEEEYLWSSSQDQRRDEGISGLPSVTTPSWQTVPPPNVPTAANDPKSGNHGNSNPGQSNHSDFNNCSNSQGDGSQGNGNQGNCNQANFTKDDSGEDDGSGDDSGERLGLTTMFAPYEPTDFSEESSGSDEEYPSSTVFPDSESTMLRSSPGDTVSEIITKEVTTVREQASTVIITHLMSTEGVEGSGEITEAEKLTEMYFNVSTTDFVPTTSRVVTSEGTVDITTYDKTLTTDEETSGEGENTDFPAGISSVFPYDMSTTSDITSESSFVSTVSPVDKTTLSSHLSSIIDDDSSGDIDLTSTIFDLNTASSKPDKVSISAIPATTHPAEFSTVFSDFSTVFPQDISTLENGIFSTDDDFGSGGSGITTILSELSTVFPLSTSQSDLTDISKITTVGNKFSTSLPTIKVTTDDDMGSGDDLTTDMSGDSDYTSPELVFTTATILTNTISDQLTTGINKVITSEFSTSYNMITTDIAQTSAPITIVPSVPTSDIVQLTTASLLVTSEGVTTSESHAGTSELPAASTRLFTTDASKQTSESMKLSTEEVTESSATATKYQGTSHNPDLTSDSTQMTTESPDITEFPKKTTNSPDETTELPKKTTESPDRTTELLEKSTESPDGTTELPKKTTEYPDLTSQHPTKTTESPQKTTQLFSTESPKNTSTTTTKNGLDERNMIEGSFRITKGASWDEELRDTSSLSFEQLSSSLNLSLTGFFSSNSLTDDFMVVKDITFKPGSVLVIFLAEFSLGRPINMSLLMEQFSSELLNGSFFSEYIIDPNSVALVSVAIDTTSTLDVTTDILVPTQGASKQESSLPNWAIGVFVGGAVLVLFVVMVIIVVVCIRMRKDSVDLTTSPYRDLQGKYARISKSEMKRESKKGDGVEFDNELAVSSTTTSRSRIKLPHKNGDVEKGQVEYTNPSPTEYSETDSGGAGVGSEYSTLEIRRRSPAGTSDEAVNAMAVINAAFDTIQYEERSGFEMLDENYPQLNSQATNGTAVAMVAPDDGGSITHPAASTSQSTGAARLSPNESIASRDARQHAYVNNGFTIEKSLSDAIFEECQTYL